MNRPALFTACMLLALSFSCTRGAPMRSEMPRETARRRELKPRWKIPLEARDMLTRRMARHGDRMFLMMESVVLLDYDLAEKLAEELAAEPKLGKPASGEKDTLSALLPEGFFEYQDELAKRANELAAAARAHDDAELTEALSSVTKTCVGCHAAYLYEGEEPEELDRSHSEPTETKANEAEPNRPGGGDEPPQ